MSILSFLFLIFHYSHSLENTPLYCSCCPSCQTHPSQKELWRPLNDQCMEETESERIIKGNNLDLKNILDETKRWVIPLLGKINDDNRIKIKDNCSACDVIAYITMDLDIPEKRKKDIKKTCNSKFSSTHHFYKKQDLMPNESCTIEKERSILRSFDPDMLPFMDPRIRGQSNQSKEFYDKCPAENCDATFKKVLKIDPVTCQGYLELTATCTDLLPKKWLIFANVPYFDVRITYRPTLQCLKEDYPSLCPIDNSTTSFDNSAFSIFPYLKDISFEH